MMKLKINILLVIGVIFIMSCDTQVTNENNDKIGDKEITNFKECVNAGHPVMESYPRQCRTEDGKFFVEKLESEPKDEDLPENYCILHNKEVIQCLDHQISATDGTFRLRLTNNFGETINVSSISLSTNDTTNAYICINPPEMPTGWQQGYLSELVWTGCSGGGIIAGSKGKVFITIKFHSIYTGPAYTKEAKAEAFSTVI